jgi:urease accessory protein
MFDTCEAATLQRVHGAARVRLGSGSGTGSGKGTAARLEQLWQSGSAKAMLPRVHDAPAEVVFLNTAGGLTGGDRLSYALGLGAGARAVATTQTAERIYRALGGAADVDIGFDLERGARLDWLPQETILYDGARLSRRVRADLGRDAVFLYCEMIVLGRAAMGERVGTLSLEDRREVIREGRPVLIEPLRLCDAALARAGGSAMLSGAGAFATLALVAPGAEDAVAALRRVLPSWAAASGWDGRCIARYLAPDARALRRAVAGGIIALGGRLPRVWKMGGL